MSRNLGFTLLELVLAIAVFGLMASLAYGGLNSLTTQGRWLEREAERFGQVQKALHLIESDIQFAVRRGVRDALGGKVAAMLGGTDEQLLQLTKAQKPYGEGNNLVRIHYRYTDDVLQRQVWPVLDRLPEHEGVTADLLSGLQKLEIRFLGVDEWHATWPIGTRADESEAALPRAVELKLELADGESYRRVFSIPGSG